MTEDIKKERKRMPGGGRKSGTGTYKESTSVIRVSILIELTTHYHLH